MSTCPSIGHWKAGDIEQVQVNGHRGIGSVGVASLPVPTAAVIALPLSLVDDFALVVVVFLLRRRSLKLLALVFNLSNALPALTANIVRYLDQLKDILL